MQQIETFSSSNLVPLKLGKMQSEIICVVFKCLNDTPLNKVN
jgi:hypothetical protein